MFFADVPIQQPGILHPVDATTGMLEPEQGSPIGYDTEYVASHTHKNKAVLDSILAVVKKGDNLELTDSNILSSLRVMDAIDEVAANINYHVEIVSLNGNTFRNDNIDTTLIAKVYRGYTDITDTIPGTAFRWKRRSNDAATDALWNATYEAVYSNTIYLTDLDVDGRAVFNCEVTIEY